MPFAAFQFSPFDRIVLTTLLGLVLLTGLVVWRGDQVGVRVIALTPAEGATEVSTRTSIQVTFDQAMQVLNSDLLLSITPAVSGTISWQGETLSFAPTTPLAPGTTYTVEVVGNLVSQQGRAMERSLAWQFQTGQPRVLYAAPDQQAHEQLFVTSATGSQPVQLTQEAYGVWDFVVSPDGTAIAYAAFREDGGSDLWLVAPTGGEPRQLLACPEAACSGAAWSPDGQRFVYERRPMLAPGAAPGPPRLWWLNLKTGETVALFQDSQWLGYGARWSPDGQWLSYVAPTSQGIQVYNVVDGRSFLISSRMGGLAVWSPQGDALLVTDIQRQDEGFAVHILRAEPESDQLTDLSGVEMGVEDSSPVWSPDGAWIAFARKAAGASMGKQLWVMRPDGSEARYLTADPEIHHSLPEWSPDSRYLLFQRYPLKELGAQPSIWLFDTKTERSQELISPGNRPIWLP